MKLSLKEINLNPSTKVLVRVDFNIPLELGKKELEKYQHRLRESIPTINYLVQNKCRVVLCTHVGRPKGQVDESLRLKPIAHLLSSLLGQPVTYIPEVIGPNVKTEIEAMQPGEVALIENLRFDPGEEQNDPEFASKLASLCDLYVMDGFAVAHRAHASTVGIQNYLPSCMGLLVEKEVVNLTKILQSTTKPYVALMGGSKVSDKILLIDNLLSKIDYLLIGGGMANTFLKAQGHPIGQSAYEPELLEYASNLMQIASEKQVQLMIPTDLIVSETFSNDVGFNLFNKGGTPSNSHIMDIGPDTIYTYSKIISQAKSLIWNGPMGVFEFPNFKTGTRDIGNAVASNQDMVSVVGGGSTAEAVEELNIAAKITHVSTGGGASLDFMSGTALPGITSLPDSNI